MDINIAVEQHTYNYDIYDQPRNISVKLRHGPRTHIMTQKKIIPTTSHAPQTSSVKSVLTQQMDCASNGKCPKYKPATFRPRMDKVALAKYFDNDDYAPAGQFWLDDIAAQYAAMAPKSQPMIKDDADYGIKYLRNLIDRYAAELAKGYEVIQQMQNIEDIRTARFLEKRRQKWMNEMTRAFIKEQNEHNARFAEKICKSK